MGDDNSPDKKSGCGLLNAVFGRRNIWPGRTASNGSLPTVNHVNSSNNNNNNFVKIPSNPDSKRRKPDDDDPTILEIKSNGKYALAKPTTTVSHHQHRCPPYHNQNNPRKAPPQETSMVPSFGSGSTRSTSSYQSQSQPYLSQGRKVPREAIGISGELENIVADHQKSSGSASLVRASSSNVMLSSQLGNLRQQPGRPGTMNLDNIFDYLPKTANEDFTSIPKNNNNKNNTNNHNHNINGGSSYVAKEVKAKPSVDASLCRALSTRMDPETLKIMGNEDYKNGRFAEALALYDAAISIDPNKASYRSNKSAALTALGRMLDAVFECREAIRIEPQYHRAHHRLATLCLRLGDTQKAIYHFKHSGPEADHVDVSKAKTLQAHLDKCTEAKRLKDWNTLIKEASAALSAGADSAPQIYALKAEAFLKLNRHQDADNTMSQSPNFDVDACTKFFGPISNANLLVTRGKVDMVVGRFDDALEAAQKAARLDSNNKEANAVMRRARNRAAARSNGNELFKAARFTEACAAYNEGLEHDPYNAVLLCNRAACRSKLGLLDKAIDDCNTALNVRPSYAKARLRRADCNAKLGRWEASIHDYEALLRETPGDEEVSRALSDVQARLRQQRGE